MEVNVGIIAVSQTELLSLMDIILLSALLSSLGVYWVFYLQNILISIRVKATIFSISLCREAKNI